MLLNGYSVTIADTQNASIPRLTLRGFDSPTGRQPLHLYGVFALFDLFSNFSLFFQLPCCGRLRWQIPRPVLEVWRLLGATAQKRKSEGAFLSTLVVNTGEKLSSTGYDPEKAYFACNHNTPSLISTPSKHTFAHPRLVLPCVRRR